MEFELEKLPYTYDALMPVMDAETVETHYAKHHATYLNNLNVALKKHPEIEGDIESLLTNLKSLPEDISLAVRNNGGGYFNHNIFWKCLSPKKNQQPSKKFLQKIIEDFGSFEEFKEKFYNAGLKHFGSGWVYLVSMPDKKLQIITTPNQDTPLIYGKPLLAVDLWEHAYYLKYKNKRADYLASLWGILNWEFIENQYYN